MAYATVTVPGDGSTTLITASFAIGEISQEHVTVRVTGEVDGSGDPVYRTYTKVGSSQYQVNGLPCPANQFYVVERRVPKEALLVDWEDGDPITEANLNTAQKQAIMIAHEALDQSTFSVKTSDNTDGPTIERGPAGTLPIWDAAGNLIKGPSAGDITTAQENAQEAKVARDQAVAAAVEAENVAESLEGALNNTTKAVSTVAQLKALSTDFKLAYLYENNKSGVFAFKVGDYSALVSSDPLGGVYIASDTVSTTAGAWVRQFNGAVNPFWYGAIGDNSNDDYPAIHQAIISGFPVHFPKPPVYYKHTAALAIDGSGKRITCEPGVVFNYTSNVGAAWTLTGTKHEIQLGEILASSAPYCLGYFNLDSSHITIGTLGQCTVANVVHDAGLQTMNAGNNVWHVATIQGGTAQYGMDIKSHGMYTLEGETWYVNVIYSSTVVALRIGTAGNNKVRWNEYHIAPDGQGITPMLVDVYNDANFINLRKWAGVAGAPPVAHVRFNNGTGGNILVSQPGTFGPLTVLDTPGTNWSLVPGQAGTMKLAGKLALGTDVAGSKLHVADNASGGSSVLTLENTSPDNVLTKRVTARFTGRDTVGSGKDVLLITAQPKNSDWGATQTIVYGRDSDTVLPVLWLSGVGSPEGVVTAQKGALYTRVDGTATTTLYVKTEGTGNTGWTAK